MAQGDLTVVRETVVLEAIVGAVAASDGMGWFDTSGYKQAVVHIEGITTATVQIRGSNQAAMPGATDDEVLLISEVTADAMSIVTAVPRWMKIMVSAWTTGTINVYVMLRP